MRPNEFLRLWELNHGELNSKGRSKLLAAPELPQILNFSDDAISRRVPNQRVLGNLLKALNFNGARVQKTGETSFGGVSSAPQQRRDIECIHGLAEPQCHLCKNPPQGIPRTVWVTAGGTRFHKDRECDSLDHGQGDADIRGDRIHDRRTVGWAEVSDTRSPCKTCFRGLS